MERVIAKIEAFDVAKVTRRFGPDQTSLEKTIEGDLVSIFGHDTVEYRRYCDAISLDHAGIVMSFDGPSDDGGRSARKYVAEGKEAAIQTLKSAINWLHDEIGDAVESESVLAPARATSALNCLLSVHPCEAPPSRRFSRLTRVNTVHLRHSQR